MFNKKSFKACSRKSETGNAVVIILVVLVVVAVGAVAYLSGWIPGSEKAQTAANQAPAAGEAQQASSENNIEVKPGNPVVAKVGDEEITRVDVFNYLQNLPPSARQNPLEAFPVAREQLINVRIISKKAKTANLDNDPEVKKQLALAKENIVRTVYVQNEVSKRMTDERLKQVYETYKAQFPDIDEVKASHILVDEESQARDIIKKLKEGADFTALAQEYSKDGTAGAGGQIGYFAKNEVVPAFAEAAFATDAGAYTTSPVKTDFGYHIIKVEEKRKRPVPDFETAKPFLETQLQRIVLDEVVGGWRNAAHIERFDINGEEIEPAGGDEAPAAAQGTASE